MTQKLPLHVCSSDIMYAFKILVGLSLGYFFASLLHCFHAKNVCILSSISKLCPKRQAHSESALGHGLCFFLLLTYVVVVELSTKKLKIDFVHGVPT